MNFKKWLLENILWVLVALVVVNFLIVYWGTVNLGIYGTRSSFLKWDLLQRKKLLLEEQVATTDGQTDDLVIPGQRSGAVASDNLVLTCSDDDLASAFTSVRPAVVNITADKTTSRRGGPALTSSVVFDDPAIQFVEEASLGSGIIVDRRGYIVTNAHVVASAVNIKVITFSSGREVYPAVIIRKDMENDIAILKIEPDAPLPTAILGDSDLIKVADKVLTVGSPFGLEQTVTAGIISDDSRDLVIDTILYEDMIQTDAAINRGNSGGPLVNGSGEVIAINTAIYAPTGVFTGVGFAIPINKVKPIVKETIR
ncbi:S1C family serine protease [Planctomycetota bacterium]